jgi:hypothetical protein
MVLGLYSDWPALRDARIVPSFIPAISSSSASGSVTRVGVQSVLRATNPTASARQLFAAASVGYVRRIFLFSRRDHTSAR